MNNKYAVYLTTYHGNKLPPFYIGYAPLDKIANGYNGTVTSKKYKAIWDAERACNPDKFKTVPISFAATREEAVRKEEYFQRQFNVVSNPMYINCGWATSPGRPVGIPCKRTTKQKIGAANSKPNPKLSLALKGKKQQQQLIDKRASSNRGKRWYNNGENELKCVVPPDGYSKGRLACLGLDRTGTVSPTKGRAWYNNGLQEKMFHEGTNPVEYTKGKLTHRGKLISL